MEQVLLALVLASGAAVVAAVLRRRQRTAPPTQPTFLAPAQLDRAGFARPEAPFLVVVFTSSTCHSCAAMADKARVLVGIDAHAVHQIAKLLGSRYQDVFANRAKRIAPTKVV